MVQSTPGSRADDEVVQSTPGSRADDEVVQSTSGSRADDEVVQSMPRTSADEVVKSMPPSRSSLAANLLHFKMPEQPPSIEAKAKAGAKMTSPERSLFIDNIINIYVKACKTR